MTGSINRGQVSHFSSYVYLRKGWTKRLNHFLKVHSRTQLLIYFLAGLLCRLRLSSWILSEFFVLAIFLLPWKHIEPTYRISANVILMIRQIFRARFQAHPSILYRIALRAEQTICQPCRSQCICRFQIRGFVLKRETTSGQKSRLNFALLTAPPL